MPSGLPLNELTKPGQADLKRAFELFSENASKIKDMRQDFSKHANEMEASGKAYFLNGTAMTKIMIILISSVKVINAVQHLAKPMTRSLKITWV